VISLRRKIGSISERFGLTHARLGQRTRRVAALGLLCARSGFAQPATLSADHQVTLPQPLQEPKAQEQWYGLPIVIADATAILMLGGAVLSTPTHLVIGGVSALVYTAGGPLTHLVESQSTTAASSLGLRLLPLAVGVPLVYVNQNDRDMVLPAVGLSIIGAGGLLAMIIDSAVLAWRPTTDAPRVALIPSHTADGTTTLTFVGTW
jgi:hypothetical protein